MTTAHHALTAQASDAAIDTACRLLRLPTMRAQAADTIARAEREGLSYAGFLAELLMAECEDRDRRRAERRIRAAHFPREKSLREFDYSVNPNVDPAVIHNLATCEWIAKGHPLCLIGDSGTGKSHLLIALGTAAAMAGYRVRYTTAAALVNELVEAADDKQLGKTIARYGRVDLLEVDELGYLELDRRGAEMLFQVLTEREEKNSIAIASNEAFTGWSRTFTDPRLCAAIVDRLTFNATIIETGTESYRLARTKAQRTTPRSTPSRRHGVAEISRGERGRQQTQPHRASFARIIVQVVHETLVPQSLVRTQIAGQLAPPPRHIKGHKLSLAPRDHLSDTPRREITLVHHEGNVRVILHAVEQPGPRACQGPEGSLFPEEPDRTHRRPARRDTSGERLLQESVHIKTRRSHIANLPLPPITPPPTIDLRPKPQTPRTPGRKDQAASRGPGADQSPGPLQDVQETQDLHQLGPLEDVTPGPLDSVTATPAGAARH
jgi:DNA replication protein DnaC